MSVYFVKVPPKSDLQSITKEPKYQAKALTVVTDTTKTAGAAVVVTIPSIVELAKWATESRSQRKRWYHQGIKRL